MLSKSEIDYITQIIEEYGHSKKIERELKYNGLYGKLMDGEHEPFTKVLFDKFFFDDVKVCDSNNETKFEGLSVGYRYCGKASSCECARRSVANNVSSSKSNKSQSDKEKTNNKRIETVRQRYGVDNVFQSDNTKKKIADSMVGKYGVIKPLQCDEIKNKAKETCIDRYGVSNVMQAKSVRDSLIEKYGHISALSDVRNQEKARDTLYKVHGVHTPMHISESKDKMMATNLLRYGHVNVSYNDDVKKRISEGILSYHYSSREDVSMDAYEILSNRDTMEELYQSKSIATISNDLGVNATTIYSYLKGHDIKVGGKYNRSMAEVEVCEFIESLGFSVETNVRSLDGVTEIDILIPEKNIAVEVNGIYWHTENHGGKGRKYHLNKTSTMNDMGIELIHMWDTEWNNKRDIAKSRLAAKLGVSNRRIYARKCQVVELSNQEATSFLKSSHIQGSAPASIRYGLVHEGEVVMVMTIGKTRYNKSYQYELIRMASSLNTSVVGGASKLFKFFINNHSVESIISYSDNRWNSGAVYEQLGFQYISASTPSYYYTKDYKTLMNRVKFQKHKLNDLLETFDPAQSEWENMKNNNYDRVWDCGTRSWGWRR